MSIFDDTKKESVRKRKKHNVAAADIDRIINQRNSVSKPVQHTADEGREEKKQIVGKMNYKSLMDKARNKKGIDVNKAVLFSTVLGIMAIIFFYQMVDTVSPGLGLILLFLGMTGFIPLGLIVGKFFLDPYMRCKMLRKMRGKNYGLAYFVYKGGQRVDIKIKNMDSDVIVVENSTKIWVLENGSIYYVDREDNKMFHAEIMGNNVVTTPQDVPIVFLDPDSMLPLSFYKRDTETNPQQAGASLLGFVNNQIAKNAFFKKTDTIFYLLMLGISMANLAGLVMLYDALVGF